MRRHGSILAIGAILLTFFLAGCQPEEKKPASDVPPGGEGKLQIGGIVFQDDQFFKLAERGMKEQGAKDGVTVTVNNSGNALDKEIALIDTYTAKKVNAIVMAPVSVKGSVPALKKANDAGIKIITYDMAIDADFPVAVIRTDPSSLGQQTGEAARKYIEKKMNGKAKIAVITYKALAPEAALQRTKGFEDEVKKLPGVTIVTEQDAWLAPEAATLAESILTAHPDIDMIWAANEGGTVGAVTAVKNGGKAGKVVVFGTDISEQMADFLLADDNILQAVTGQRPLDIGAQAVATAVKALKNEPVEKQVILKGVLFTREKPDEVKKIRDFLHSASQ